MESLKYFGKYEHCSNQEIIEAYDSLREKFFITGNGTDEEETELDILNFIIIEKFKEFMLE